MVARLISLSSRGGCPGDSWSAINVNGPLDPRMMGIERAVWSVIRRERRHDQRVKARFAAQAWTSEGPGMDGLSGQLNCEERRSPMERSGCIDSVAFLVGGHRLRGQGKPAQAVIQCRAGDHLSPVCVSRRSRKQADAARGHWPANHQRTPGPSRR